MKSLARFALVFAALSFGSAAAESPVQVMYIANEGFLIEAGGRHILIDAIFDDRSITYAHVPDEKTLSLMRASKAPFDDIDLVLVTHFHRDHFSVAPMLEHLQGNPSGVLIGPPQMVDALRAVEPEFEGHTILHVGDAVLSQNLELFEEEGFQKKKIDIVFLEFFDWSDETKSILDQWMTPDHVVFMHLPPDPEKIRQIEAHLLEKFPNAVVFVEPMEEKAL